jgi:hypothetical protein
VRQCGRIIDYFEENKLAEEQILNHLEHNLLSMQVDDIEPLFILYADTIRDVKGATLDTILQALTKLMNLGYTQCTRNEEGTWHPCNNLTFEDLKNRFEGQSEEEKKQYPMHVNEYYFQITDKGREEEAKTIYDAYYPEL